MAGKATITFEVSEDKEGVNVSLNLGTEKRKPQWEDLDEAQVLAFATMQTLKEQMKHMLEYKDEGSNPEVSRIVSDALAQAKEETKH